MYSMSKTKLLNWKYNLASYTDEAAYKPEIMVAWLIIITNDHG